MIGIIKQLFCGVLVLTFFAVPASFANTQDGQLIGFVLDQNGDPMPGVTVTVSGPAMQGERMAVTDEDGRWRVPLIPVGRDYRVAAVLDGFQRVIQTGLTVNIGESERVDFTMVEATGDLGEIIVTAEAPLIDARKSSIGETITYEFMEDIPTGRSYFDAMTMAAGVAGTANVFVHGAGNRDNVFLIDGVDTTDNGSGTFGINFSYEAIQEVEMKTGAFEAEYGRATGSIVNVVTKSGGNEFHGAVPIYYTNLDLRRHQNLDTNPADEEDYYNIEGAFHLGGPIIRDQLWFFASYSNSTRRTTGINEFDESLQLSEVFEEYMAKLTWQINPDNKVIAQYASDPATIDSRDALSTDPIIQSSALGIKDQGGYLAKLQWTSIFTPNLFLEVKLAHHEVMIRTGPANAEPGLDGDIQIIDDNFGGTRIYSGNSGTQWDDLRPREMYSAIFNYYKGDWGGEHNFKFGAEYQDFHMHEDGLFCNTITINRVDGEGNPLPDRWSYSTPLLAENGGDILTFFAQDAWTWRDNWTFNLGLRWESQTQTHMNESGGQSPAYDLDNLLAPRAGVSWDIRGDGRSKAYFNYARYFDAVGTWLGSYLNRSTSTTYRYEGTYDPNDPFNPDNWDLLSSSGGDSSSTQIDPDLTPNFKDEVILGYEFEFATDFSAGAKLIYNWQDTMIEDRVGNYDEILAGETNDYWYYFTNFKNAERDYKGLELQLKKRLSSNYQFLLVYTLSEAKGSVAGAGQAEGYSYYGDIPETIHNRYGYLPWDDRHYVKLNGSYHLPWGIVAGTSFGWRSGRPYTRAGLVEDYAPIDDYPFNGYNYQYFVEPRGSYRLGSVWWLDLRVSKDFNIKDTELSVLVDFFNVTNNQYVTGRRERDTSSFGVATDWQNAGSIVFGVKYSF